MCVYLYVLFISMVYNLMTTLSVRHGLAVAMIVGEISVVILFVVTTQV